MDKIQRKTDWVDHVLLILAIFFIGLCVVVVKTAKAHHDEVNQPQPEPVVWTGPPIPKCDKELWLRIKDGCP